MSKRKIDIQLRRLEAAVSKEEHNIAYMIRRNREREEQFEKNVDSIKSKIDDVRQAINSYKDAVDREAQKEIRELKKQLKAAQLNSGSSLNAIETFEGLEKAKTLAIFDSILFAIENWSEDGQTAPDMTMVSQSILFPAVYERVLSGNEDYVLETVPVVAVELVKRGREFVKHIREICTAPLSDPNAWETHSKLIQQWWVRDGLPLIYGARDPDWEEDTPLSHVEIMEWREKPASRALDFPLIFDGMELISRYQDQIRDTTNLPDFTLQTQHTRLLDL